MTVGLCEPPVCFVLQSGGEQMATKNLSTTEAPAGDDRLAELIAKDRPKTIIHEVGHLTVALALGYPAEVWIQPTNTSDTLNEKTWTGSCRLNWLFRPRTNRENTMIGLAGWLAVLLHENPDADLYTELCGFLDEGLSETDLGMVTLNNRWIIRWGQEVWDLLKEFTAFREWAEAKLFENTYVSAEEAIEAFPAKRKLARYNALNKKMQKLAEEAMKRFREGSGGTTP
jgi:hypothetical protein